MREKSFIKLFIKSLESHLLKSSHLVKLDEAV